MGAGLAVQLEGARKTGMCEGGPSGEGLPRGGCGLAPHAELPGWGAVGGPASPCPGSQDLLQAAACVGLAA